MPRKYAAILLLPGCAPICSGVATGPDIVITAAHCTEGQLRTTAATLSRPAVRVGDTLQLDGLCSGPREGVILELDGNRATVDAPACNGDSGGPATYNGILVGVVIRTTVPAGRAVVALFE